MRSPRLFASLSRNFRAMATLAAFQSTKKSRMGKYCLSVVAAGGVAGLLAQYKVTQAECFFRTAKKIDTSLWMSEPITEIKQLEKTLESSTLSKMEKLCMDLQGELCRMMEELDGQIKFRVDKWSREKGGGGISCVMQNGKVFEKAGVNISVIHGMLPVPAIEQMRSRSVLQQTTESESRGKNLKNDHPLPFKVTGISSVIHPRNPHVPTVHFNFRYFEVDVGDGETMKWFGGGTDLTPTFLVEEDVAHFHKTLKEACDKHDPNYYKEFKAWCDNYFFIKHRGERRGVGGIFFDDVEGPTTEKAYEFVLSCAKAIMPAYLPIVKKHINDKYSYSDRQWQLLRRGRYVEFNLVYDRGTKFGLLTPGPRIDSILMSLPLNAKWEYGHQVEPGSKEAELLEVLIKPREWAAEETGAETK